GSSWAHAGAVAAATVPAAAALINRRRVVADMSYPLDSAWQRKDRFKSLVLQALWVSLPETGQPSALEAKIATNLDNAARLLANHLGGPLTSIFCAGKAATVLFSSLRGRRMIAPTEGARRSRNSQPMHRLFESNPTHSFLPEVFMRR